MSLILKQVSSMSAEWRLLRNAHYVPNHGSIGRQLHYLVYDGSDFFSEPIAAIAGGSAVWACAGRDKYFGINKANRAEAVQTIIDNTVFRLTKNEPNLASMILRAWRERVIKDWQSAYGGEVIGFETFVYGDNRSGACYKADGWANCGVTTGVARIKMGKMCTSPFAVCGGKDKIILCRWADNKINERARREIAG